jgi:microcystin-dependent protein
MAKITRYNGNLKSFASEQLTNERTLFGQTAISNDLTSQFTPEFLRGWGIVGPSDQPSLQDFNAAIYTNGQLLAYLHQMGIPEYNAAQEYYVNSVTQSGGVLYISLADSNIGNVPVSSPAQWANLSGQAASTTVAGLIAIATNPEALAGAVTNKAIVPSSLKSVIAARGIWDVSVASSNANTSKSVGLYSLAASTPNAPTTDAYQMSSSDPASDPTWQIQQAQGVAVNRLFIRSIKKDQSSTTGWTEVHTTANNNMVGASVGFYLNSPPAGWLKENGAAVSRTTYAALFAIIGTAFGAGDGSTTFNLPDHRGEFPRGTDDTRGVDPGRLVGSTQAQAIQSHSHVILNKATSFSFSAGGGGNAAGGQTTGATELTGGTETRPRNIAKLYCIKY